MTHLLLVKTPTERDAIALTVSVSSQSFLWAPRNDIPTVLDNGLSDDQYWPETEEETALLTGLQAHRQQTIKGIVHSEI